MTSLLDAMQYPRWILPALLLLPLLSAALLPLIARKRAAAVSFALSTVIFVLSIGLWWVHDPASPAMQLTMDLPWIASLGIRFHLGVDGISVLLVLLTTFITPIAILGSFKYIDKNPCLFYSMMLVLEAAIIGVFISLDLFLFFVFWEVVLVPMYFIIGIWGGDRRIYAAVKFFLFTAVGSLLMLVAILYLHFRFSAEYGVSSFAWADMLKLHLSMAEQLWLFGAFTLAFAIKVPMFPLHTWLPDAHVEAPTPGSVILAALLLKMGTYGFLRFSLPLFPMAASNSTVIEGMMILAVIGIIYGAMVAAVQPDAKKLVAYTSVSHLGFVVLGTFAFTLQGVEGGMMINLAHGVSTGALFILIGMLYERRHTREISAFGGLASVTPLLAIAFVVTAFASIGLPGLSGFVGEFLVLIGAFHGHPTATILASLGVIVAAWYMLPMVQRIFFQKLDKKENADIHDLSAREMAVLIPLLLAMVWIGVYPKPFLNRMESSVQSVIQRVEGGTTHVVVTSPGGAQ